MSWLRRAPPAAGPGPGPVPPGAGTWAARGRSGPVPAGWVGLQVLADGSCAAWAEVGQDLASLRRKASGATAWWVRCEPWQFSFAPWPGLAPEAGLQVAMQLDCPPDADHRNLLAARLADELDDVGVLQWTRQLRQMQAVTALPPCAPPGWLAAQADVLSQAVWPDWQARITGLQRVDLDEPWPADPGAAAHAPHVHAPVAAPNGAAQPGLADAVGAPLSPTAARAPTLQAMLAQDRRACRQLADGLPRLGLALQRRWAGGGWSSDAAVAARQRAISQQLGLMAAKLGALPSLQPRPGARRAPTPAERSMVLAEALQATEALARASAAERALPPPRNPPVAAQLQPLEQALASLASHLDHRLMPWWE